jgi:hypothetical protein
VAGDAGGRRGHLTLAAPRRIRDRPRMPTPRRCPLAALAALAAFAACSATPALPDGEGRGLIAFDPAPPPGAETWQRPEWRVGDRQVLRRGGELRVELGVVRADDAGYELRDAASGLRIERDRDLAGLRDLPPPDSGDVPLRATAPRDVRYHWPLWIGKRWRCHLVDKAPSGDAVPLEVRYEVEGLDTVQVPAGTFRCLRVLRTARVDAPGRWLERTSITWYSPDAGIEVRQVIDGTAVELVEWSAPR